MQSRVGFWGGSCAIRLPKMAVEALGLHGGETVTLEIERGALTIRPAKPRYGLSELVKQAKALRPPEPHDDGPMGSEVL